KAGKVLDKLEPGLIVRPWTDDPSLPAGASEPTPTASFAAGLAHGQDFAAAVTELARGPAPRGLAADLVALASDQLPNQTSLDWLERWAKEADGVYLEAG